MDFIMIQAAKTDKKNMVSEKGAINGGIFQRSSEAKTPLIVIGVASINETVEKITASGGKLMMPK